MIVRVLPHDPEAPPEPREYARSCAPRSGGPTSYPAPSMQDALGAVQSVLVLGGGSEIALATMRELVARRARTVVLAGRDPAALAGVIEEVRGLGATTVEAVRFDARATDEHTAFVDTVFDAHGDFDLVLVAFGVLGDQEVAERDGAAAVEVATTNYVGTISVCLLYTSPSPRDGLLSRMPSS